MRWTTGSSPSTPSLWSEQAHLGASDGASGDAFGWSVAVSGDTAVVGAAYDDTPGGVNAGSAYTFGLSSPNGADLSASLSE